MTSHLYDIARQRALQYPGAAAVGGQIGLQWQTYDSAGLLKAADAAAAELAALGVGRGDRVVLWVPNHLWAPAFLFGLWRLGAIAVPFDREMNPEAWFGILAFGLFPLRQHQQRDINLRRLLKAADAGNAVLVYPQGTHARPEDEVGGHPGAGFHTGVTHLARALEAAVVPFGVAGTEKVLPAFLEGYQGLVIAGIPMSFTPGPLAIAFGAPMSPERDEGAEAFTERLQEECFHLTRAAEAAWNAAHHSAGAVQLS